MTGFSEHHAQPDDVPTVTDAIPAWERGELRPVDKLEVHHRGLRHKAVSVFVMVGERLLIQRRSLAKYHTPGLWANTCCTHPRWREAPGDCASRRLLEELGIVGLELEHRDRVEYRAAVGGGMVEHELVDIFLARPDSAPPLAPDPAEVMDVRWIALPDLAREIDREPERFTPWLRIYLDRHGEQIFGRDARLHAAGRAQR